MKQANRSEMPESLAAQLPVIYDVLNAMNIPQFSMEGFEAVDLLATISRQLESEVAVKVVSGDKDLLQLVTERVHIIRPGRSSVVETEIDPARLEETMGLRADQIVDYLALVGDSSDNVPGVRGIGQKTALKLLQAYGSLDALYDSLDAVEPASVRNKLAAGREHAFMSRDLVRLVDDAPLEVALADRARGEMRTEEFRALLEELEFGRLMIQVFGDGEATGRGKAVEEAAPSGEAVPEAPSTQDATMTGEPEYVLADTPEVLGALAKKLEAAPEFAVDVETSGLDPMRAVLAGIAIATAPGEAYYVPVTSKIGDTGLGLVPADEAPGLPLEAVRQALGPVFAAETPSKI